MYPDDGLSERIDRAETVFSGRLLKVERISSTLPNGKPALRETVRHVGAVGILPVDGDGFVYLERQYRTALDGILTEIPAGKLDSRQEDRLAAAKRELREETGLEAERWDRLGEIVTTPGFSDEMITLFLARGLSSTDVDPDEDEFIEVFKVPYRDLLRGAKEGRIRDSKTLCALFLASPYLEDIP